MNIPTILLGLIPEAIYFVIFILLTKQFKEHKILFTTILVIEYVLIFSTLQFNSYAHLLFFIMTYCLMKILYNIIIKGERIRMKILYKEKCQIIDIFTLGIASIILVVLSAISFLLLRFNMILAVIFGRILIFTFLFVMKSKLHLIQDVYKKLWNRNDKIKKKIKSTTFRAINVIIFNLMFYIINLGMLYMLFIRR